MAQSRWRRLERSCEEIETKLRRLEAYREEYRRGLETSQRAGVATAAGMAGAGRFIEQIDDVLHRERESLAAWRMSCEEARRALIEVRNRKRAYDGVLARREVERARAELEKLEREIDDLIAFRAAWLSRPGIGLGSVKT